jgi:hypothetical protein
MSGKESMPPQLPSFERESGLYLEAHFEPDLVRIVRSEPITRVARARLRAPIVTEDYANTSKPDAAEVVLTILDSGGFVLDAFAWPQAARAFFDRSRGDDERGDIDGGPTDARTTLRILRVPIRPEAEYLFFYGSESRRVAGSERRALFQRPMGLYHLKSDGPPSPTPPPLPIPTPIPLKPMPLPYIPKKDRRLWWERMLASVPSRSFVKEAQTLVNNGPPASCFDIVILGDGFIDDNLWLFDQRALDIANALLTMPPFSTMAATINVHAVRVVSEESGITDCPAASTPRRTFFEMRGNFGGQGFAGFVGTDVPERIYAAAEWIAPREDLEIFLMLANCNIDGGSAFPDLRLACGTMGTPLAKAANVAAHEIAHVAAGVCEEYISCVAHDPMFVYPNQGTSEQVQADTITWKALATAAELDGSNAFRAVHVHGDPFDADDEPIVAPHLTGMLGLYWGCQDALVDSLPGNPYQDPCGAQFFRAMARCRMRRTKFPFCRVCEAKIAEAILLAST